MQIMTILEFNEQFPDEQSCRKHFKEKREKEGISCKKCGGKVHYWLPSKDQWQCGNTNCKFRTTLRSGTVMHASNLPLRKWYLAMIFMTFTKKSLSTNEIKRQLGHKHYNTIWTLVHKIRMAMGERDERYILKDMVELDEGYFDTSYPSGKKFKPGRGSERQATVAVMAESTPVEDLETGKKSTACRYFKMKVLSNHSKNEINKKLESSLAKGVVVFSDNSTSYVDIKDFVELHIPENSSKELTKTTLKWVHTAIGNATKLFQGVYQMIKGKYLQNYLDEYCYKLNRRYFGERLFDRLTLAVAACRI